MNIIIYSAIGGLIFLWLSTKNRDIPVQDRSKQTSNPIFTFQGSGAQIAKSVNGILQTITDAGVVPPQDMAPVQRAFVNGFNVFDNINSTLRTIKW